MNFNDITFVSIIGGMDSYYVCFDKNVNSIKERICPSPKIVVIEIGTKKLISRNFYSYIHINSCNSSQQTYKNKFLAGLMCDTPWIVYSDCDTVFVNNIIPTCLFDNRIGVSRHWWNLTLYHHLSRYPNILIKDSSIICKEIFNLDLDDIIISGGVFIFNNTSIIRSIISEIYYLLCKYDFIQYITDEIVLAAMIKKYPQFFKILGGNINHTCNYNYINDMPLKIINGVMCGKNSFDDIFKPILTLHCDTTRRDPSNLCEDNIMKKQIREMFYIS